MSYVYTFLVGLVIGAVGVWVYKAKAAQWIKNKTEQFDS